MTIAATIMSVFGLILALYLVYLWFFAPQAEYDTSSQSGRSWESVQRMRKNGDL